MSGVVGEEEVGVLAYLITAHRFRERGLKGSIGESEIAVALPMARFLFAEGFTRVVGSGPMGDGDDSWVGRQFSAELSARVGLDPTAPSRDCRELMAAAEVRATEIYPLPSGSAPEERRRRALHLRAGYVQGYMDAALAAQVLEADPAMLDVGAKVLHGNYRDEPWGDYGDVIWARGTLRAALAAMRGEER